MADGDLTYPSVRVGLRAPRVAIVFDASGAHWDFFARLAIWQASQFWGGAGFILVPHINGDVSPLLIQAVVAHDPDYVVASLAKIADYEALEPGWIANHVQGYGEIPDDQIDDFRRQLMDDLVPDRGTGIARDTVADACSPHRRREDREQEGQQLTRWVEDYQSLEASDRSADWHTGALTALSTLPAVVKPSLACPPQWAGAWGLATAAKVGVARRPDAAADPFAPAADEASTLAWWILGRDRVPGGLPTDLIDQPGEIELSLLPEQQPAVWRKTLRDLTWVRQVGGRPTKTYLVVGDGPEDFALAYALERIFGSGVWLPSAMDPIATPSLTTSFELGLGWLRRSHQRGGEVVVTSATSDTALEAHRDRIRALLTDEGVGSSRGEKPTSRRSAVSSDRAIDWAARGKSHLGIDDRYDVPMTVPARTTEDGTTALLASLPGTMPTQPDLISNPALTWQVDVAIGADMPPAGHGLDGHQLLTDGFDPYEAWVRHSRSGITFHSVRFSFVGAGETKEQSLARPQLRTLGLASWVQALARQNDLDTRYSETGRRADILARLWGSRTDLVRDFSGPMWGALYKFTLTGKRTSEVYPDGDGVLLSDRGVLSFDGIQSGWGSTIDVPELRAQMDTLLAKGILRRGLVVACPACGHVAFVSADDLRQVNVCNRCATASNLDQARWSTSTSVAEPSWFYDLHGVARALIADNGHAPLWLADYLSTSPGRSGAYMSMAETDLIVPETQKRLAEVDLVTVRDGLVLTAEVKTSNSLGRSSAEKKSAAEKRVRWATLLRADEIVLATTHAAWDQPSVSAVRAAMNDAAWATGHTPRLHLVTDLGAAAFSQYLSP